MSVGGEHTSRPPSRWWALALVVPTVPFVLAGRFVPGGFQTRLYFAGTPERWRQVVRGVETTAGDAASSFVDVGPVDLGEARIALALDLAFAASFALVGFWLLRAGWHHWAPARRRRFEWLRAAPWAAVAAGALDVAETTAQLVWLDADDPPAAVTHLVAAVAWWKWIAYLVSAVALGLLVVGPALSPLVRRSTAGVFALPDRLLGENPPRDVEEREAQWRRPDHERPGWEAGERPGWEAGERPGWEAGERLGICASGGGIRSASVMLGALRGLTSAGLVQRARWLHAVSGGGFTAGGWFVSSRQRDDVELFDADDPWFESVRHRRRFLDNGAGSLVGGVLGALIRSVAVFGAVLAAAVVSGWLAGRLVRSWALHEQFCNRTEDVGGETRPACPGVEAEALPELPDLLPWRLLLPGLVPLVIAALLLVVARTRADAAFRRRLDVIALVSGAVGATLVLALVGVPVGIRYGRTVLDAVSTSTAERGAGVLGLLSAIGVLAAVRGLLTAELKKRWTRLGGVALGVGLFLLAGKVADDRATMLGVFHPAWVPLVALAWLWAVDVVPSHRLTLNGVYRKRLADTFCLGAGDRPPLAAVPYEDEPRWREYRRGGLPGPELVLCCTAHATRAQHGGLPALGFTFRPLGVTLHDGASALWPTFPEGTSWEGYPRAWIVSRSMAIAGAAFASAMGRQSFGTTNSLLAAVNLRLGMWVPNPRYPDWFLDPGRRPRVHLGYLAKELLNRYDPERDPFVYVADGGHRDNLGLVEQLGEQPARIVVLDASGDRPGTFATLKQAIQLAGIEHGAEVDVDFTQIAPRPDDEPIDCVTTGTVTYADGTTADLVFAKAQISDTAPVDLRQFAAANQPFPDYSTGDQFLRDDEFLALVALGEHMARRVLDVCGWGTPGHIGPRPQ